MRVRIAQKLIGEELYGVDDPVEYEKYLGKEVTVRCIKHYREWMVGIEEDESIDFYMEEIECIIDDADIKESDIPIGTLLEFTVQPVP